MISSLRTYFTRIFITVKKLKSKITYVDKEITIRFWFIDYVRTKDGLLVPAFVD